MSLGPATARSRLRQVDEALAESPGYDLIVFAGFAVTAEAQQYLAPGKRGRINVALVEANADLLLGDLLKNTKASQTFRLFAAPEAKVHHNGDGEVRIELLGMDAFDAATGRGDLPQPGRDRRLVPRSRLRRIGLPRQPGVLHANGRLGGARQGAQGHHR